MNACLSTRFTRYDYRTKKAVRVRERIERAITHLEEYVEGENKELWKDRGMIDTWARGVHVLRVHFQEVIYNGCHEWLDFSVNHTAAR